MLYQFAIPVNNAASVNARIDQPTPFIGRYRVKIIQFDVICPDFRLDSVVYVLNSQTIITNTSNSRIILYNRIAQSQNFGNHYVIENVNFSGPCDINIQRLDGLAHNSGLSFPPTGFILTCEIEKM